MPFNVGDRVRVDENHLLLSVRGQIGVVKAVFDYGTEKYCDVEFDEPIADGNRGYRTSCRAGCGRSILQSQLAILTGITGARSVGEFFKRTRAIA